MLKYYFGENMKVTKGTWVEVSNYLILIINVYT